MAENSLMAFIDQQQKAAPGVTPEMAARLELFGAIYPGVKLTSGYRDPAHNARVGGARGSAHMDGNALDFSLKGMKEGDKANVVNFWRALGATGIGYYPNSDAIHVDFRPGPARAWGANYSNSSLPQTPKWFQNIAADHYGGVAPSVSVPKTGTQAIAQATGQQPQAPALPPSVSAFAATQPPAVAQAQAKAPDVNPDDVFGRWGVGSAPKANAPANAAPAAIPAQKAPEIDADAVLSRWGVPAAGGAPKAIAAAPEGEGIRDPKTGELVVGGKPFTETGNLSKLRTAIVGMLSGVPIAGPSILAGAERAGAAARSLRDETSFAKELEAQRAINAGNVAANPGTALAGNVAGTVLPMAVGAGAFPVFARALGVTGTGMKSRMLAGAATNALIGGTDAYMRDQNPIAGAAFGGIGGALAPPVGQLIGAGANKIVDGVRYVMPTGVPGVSRPTANILGSMINADDPAAVQNAMRMLGPQGMLVDAGPSLTTVGQGLATKPGEAQSIVMNALKQRAAGANARLAADVEGAIGPAPLPSAIKGQIEAGQQALQPEYAKVFASAKRVDMQPLANQLDAIVADLRGPAQKAVRDVRGMLNIPGTSELDPNPRAMLAVRQAIDGMLAGEQNPQVIRQLTIARKAVDTELTSKVPGIKAVDAKFQELARQSEGLDRGGQILASGKNAIRPQDMATEFTESAIPAGQLVGPSATPRRIQEGARAEIDRLVGTQSNDLVALQKMLQGEGGWNTAKLQTVFGDLRANRLLESVGREAKFADTTNLVTRNSETARRQAAAKLIEETEPGAMNLTGSTMGGLALQGAKKTIVDPFMRLVMQNASEPRNIELARILTMQGVPRDQVVNAVLGLAQRQAAGALQAARAEQMFGRGVNLLVDAAHVQGQRSTAP